MSRLDEWIDVADGMVRCLTACTAEVGDRIFGAMRQLAAGAASGASDTEDRWYRSENGYVCIGAEGHRSRYQPEPPTGVDPAGLERLPSPPIGQLWAEIESAARDGRTLAADRRVERNGASFLVCDETDVDRVRFVVRILDAAASTAHADRNAALLRGGTQKMLAALGDGPQKAAEAACAEILAMREAGVVEAPVWAVTVLRREAVTRIGDALPSGTAFKLFNAAGPYGDPQEALLRTVTDLVAAGHGATLVAICDTALETAETAVQTALDAPSPRAHRSALYDATGWAYLAMRLAETMRDKVATTSWPSDLTPEILHGYVGQTEEIVVRASQAVGVSCVNEGSLACFRRHKAQVAEAGPARADELIESYLFYPRGARQALIGVA